MFHLRVSNVRYRIEIITEIFDIYEIDTNYNHQEFLYLNPFYQKSIRQKVMYFVWKKCFLFQNENMTIIKKALENFEKDWEKFFIL